MLSVLLLSSLHFNDLNMFLDMLDVCLPLMRIDRVTSNTLMISCYRRNDLSRELVLLANYFINNNNSLGLITLKHKLLFLSTIL